MHFAPDSCCHHYNRGWDLSHHADKIDWAGKWRQRENEGMQVGLDPGVASRGQRLPGVVAIEQAAVEELRVQLRVLHRRDQLEPGARHRLMERLRIPGALGDALDSCHQAVIGHISPIEIDEQARGADVRLVRKVGCPDRSVLEAADQLIVRHSYIVISDMGMIAELERAVHLVAVHIERAAGDLGVTQAEAHVLAQLDRHGAQTVGELQRSFGYKPSTLTNVLDRLDLRGLIERRLNPHDRRSFIVATTREGARAAGHVMQVLDRLEQKIAKEVTRRDIEGVNAVADALLRLADAGE